MTDLANTCRVDRHVEQLNLLPSDDSGTDDEGDNLKQSAVESSPPSRPGKLKSGREAKATSDVCISRDGFTVFFVLLECNAWLNTRS